ncbi:MAG: nucleotidyl transferase AbiEii/AbiGii toxin family protein [Candidatus Omnitrophota bacterium]|nr:nucleotidyl transferase AbiEii/AbiGii toxin family protein [Candidatus Omnitrophota bacterium]
MDTYNSLQLREVFHIEFLRQLARKVKAENYAVKGGVNLRLFFKSFRYSEDMDLDARVIRSFQLKEAVMSILASRAFRDNLKPFGITDIKPPDIVKAKQTETTQRFKIHLFSSSGEDLFTRIEFSRRGFAGDTIVGAPDDAVLRAYKLPPILVPHYDGPSAVVQKLLALAGRTSVQARDIFDLYVLSSQYAASDKRIGGVSADILSKAQARVFEVEFEQFSDAVVSYLSIEDQELYNRPKSWEEIRLKTASFIEEARPSHA